MPTAQPSNGQERKAGELLVAGAAARADVLYQTTLMARVGLPLSEPPSDLEFWYRTDGDITFILLQGVTTDEHGKPRRRGYPHGYYPRRALLELVTIAKQTRSRMIRLGPRSAFMNRLGIRPTGGPTGTIDRFTEQLEKLVDSAIAVVPFANPNVSAKATVRIADSYQLWLPRRQKPPAGFVEFVELSQTFYDHVIRHHVDLDAAIIDKLGGKALQLDVFTWLNHCFAFLPEAKEFSWDRLYQQLGTQLADTPEGRSQFRRGFRAALKAVLDRLSVADRKRVSVNQRTGVTVAPSPRQLTEGIGYRITAEELALPALPQTASTGGPGVSLEDLPQPEEPVAAEHVAQDAGPVTPSRRRSVSRARRATPESGRAAQEPIGGQDETPTLFDSK